MLLPPGPRCEVRKGGTKPSQADTPKTSGEAGASKPSAVARPSNHGNAGLSIMSGFAKIKTGCRSLLRDDRTRALWRTSIEVIELWLFDMGSG